MVNKWLVPLLLAAILVTLSACDSLPFHTTASVNAPGADGAGSVTPGQNGGNTDTGAAGNGQGTQGTGKNATAGDPGAGSNTGKDETAGNSATGQNTGKPATADKPVTGQTPGKNAASGGDADARETVAEPDSMTALVNKQHMLPDDYVPDDLVYPNVKFTFSEKIEKRMMRKEAAGALELLFAAAKKDGMPLAGVSAYRSHKRQKELFDSYVREDGLEKAETYSAFPGTSEHETGLAIDVSGADGTCQATECFTEKPEAAWLAKHAHEYGFIIRYPKDKQDITGYVYEPWHIRYVGDEAAAIYDQGLTLEEYMDTVEVTKPGAGS